MKFFSFGEILFDIYPDRECLGGAPLNLAAHAALQGTESYILSAVGDDLLGKKAVSEIEKLGIKTRFIKELSYRETGKCLVTLDENAVPSYNLMEDVAYDYIPCPDFSKDDKFDVIAFGTLAFRQKRNMQTVEEILKKIYVLRFILI